VDSNQTVRRRAPLSVLWSRSNRDASSALLPGSHIDPALHPHAHRPLGLRTHNFVRPAPAPARPVSTTADAFSLPHDGTRSLTSALRGASRASGYEPARRECTSAAPGFRFAKRVACARRSCRRCCTARVWWRDCTRLSATRVRVRPDAQVDVSRSGSTRARSSASRQPRSVASRRRRQSNASLPPISFMTQARRRLVQRRYHG
jgi:hypothetical protein